MWAKPNEVFCGNARAEWWASKNGVAVCGWFSTIFFSYYLLKFDEFIFYFQETYNSWLEKRYEDDFSTHLNIDSDLWLEAGSSGGFDGNQVYKLSNTTTENLRTTCSVSSVGCLQLVSSTQSSEFVDLLDQGVQERTTHLNEKYERFFMDYEKLCRVVMKMRSKMSGTCAPSYWPHGHANDQTPPPPAQPLF
jgi:hypothetical protein